MMRAMLPFQRADLARPVLPFLLFPLPCGFGLSLGLLLLFPLPLLCISFLNRDL